MIDEAPFYEEIAHGFVDGAAYWVMAEDRTHLRVGGWRSKSETAKGTIIVFPGRAEYIENYGLRVSKLVKRGYTVFSIDWRGQGCSERSTSDPRVGHIDHFSEYQQDARAMFKAAAELKLPKPWYLYGHSMGACIGLRSILNGLPVVACAFTSPMWGIKMSMLERAAAWPVSWLSRYIGLRHMYVPGNSDYGKEAYVLSVDYEGNSMTNDAEMFQLWRDQANAQPNLLNGGPSMGWLFAALRECSALSKEKSPEVPCVVFHGSQDNTIDKMAIQERINNWENGRIEHLEGAKHELLLETRDIRERVLDQLCEHFKQFHS